MGTLQAAWGLYTSSKQGAAGSISWFSFQITQHRAAVEEKSEQTISIPLQQVPQGKVWNMSANKGEKEQTRGSRQESGWPESRPVNHSEGFLCKFP